jgi:pimeloyl-ACP methyl ester carboxylesterase
VLLSLVHRLFALTSVIVLGVGAWLVWSWWRLYSLLDPAPGETVDTQAWRLWIGGLLIAASLLGRTPTIWLLGRPADDGERLRRRNGEVVETPTGARLFVDTEGPAEAPAIVLTHGWGMTADFWWEARRELSERFQVVAYDLAGLGRSKAPPDGCLDLDRFADDLAALVRRIAPRKAVLAGHSIGGMIVMTFCRRHPDLLASQVAGLVLANTTADNPARSTALGEALYDARPLLRPLLRLDIWLQPLVWAMNWQSYLSGATHLAMRLGGFGAQPTRAQLEQVARQATTNPPGVQAKGNLAMLDWRIEDELSSIGAPALVFIGGDDRVTRPEAGEVIVRRLPKVQSVRISEAGHMGPLEFADDYDSAVAAFAEEVFTAGAKPADLRRAKTGAVGRALRPARRPDEPRPFA